MPAQKGKTNNPNGRPKGRPNKLTMSNRTFIDKVLKKNRKQLEQDLAFLDPKDRLEIIHKFYAYTTPKLGAVDGTISGKEDGAPIHITLNLD